MTTRTALCALVLMTLGAAPVAAQAIGSPLPPWQAGVLDIHLINTGRGDAALLILPDGTTMQFDAGDGGAPVGSPRGVPVVPDGTRPTGERIARYASRVMSHYRTPGIDYGLLSHLHDDHFGAFAELARHVPIRLMLDRAWPDYGDASSGAGLPSTSTYAVFARAEPSRMARFEPGRSDQVTLLRDAAAYPAFVVRNLFANGQVWTGAGQATRSRFPDKATALAAEDRPSENESSLGIRVSYGAFDFYTGGDIPGRPRPGQADWHDIETPVAQAVGPVEVAAANHHGNRDSTNAFFVSTLQPRLWILQVWSADHPGHDVLDRMMSTRLYPGDRDVLATNISPANRIVIGPLLDRLISARGHIVIRVERGGATYRAIVLEDKDESMNVTAVFGPYQSR